MGKVTVQGGQTLISGLNRVYHCNHYNAHLQMSILMSEGIPNHNPERLLIDSVSPLIKKLKANGYSKKELIQEFSFCGFGKLQEVNEQLWETPFSHYGDSTYTHGKPNKVAYFNSGYIQGITDHFTEQSAVKALGAKVDQYTVNLTHTDNSSDYLTHEVSLSDVPPRFEFKDCIPCQTKIDENQIIEAVRSLPLFGRMGKNDTGLIDAFGVVLTNHFADYYNRISYETYFAMLQAGIPEEDIKEIFIQSGHVCAFNTFGGIMSSPEWYAVVEPMCRAREDWLHGMVAVINALGWGMYRIEKIDVEKEFIVRVYNSYEGVGYLRMYPQANEKSLSFLAMGAMLGLVHLLWKVDIRNKPTLDHEFYVMQFNNPENSYGVEQTHAIAAGDAYDRIVVYK